MFVRSKNESKTHFRSYNRPFERLHKTIDPKKKKTDLVENHETEKPWF